MKATAKVIGSSVRACAFGTGQDVGVSACGLPAGIEVTVSADDRRNLYKPIRVTPEAPQMLVWLTPGNEIEYRIITNLDWNLI